MTRALVMTTWVAISTLLVAACHYYLWTRLVRDPAWPAPWRQLSSGLIVLLAVLLPTSMAATRFLRAEVAKPLAWAGYLWMGFAFFLLLVVGMGDLIKLTAGAYARVAADPLDVGRRAFFSRVLGGSAAAGAVLMGGVAVRSALARPFVKKVRVALERLPVSMNGLCLVQISDLHVGPTIGREEVEDLVRRTNALQPDIVAITGDLVDGTVAELSESVAPLEQLRARLGTFFVTGNHEYYSGAENWIAELTRLGIRVLRNEAVAVKQGEACIYVAGVDDHSAHRFSVGHGCDVEAACRGCEPDSEIILLAHQPKAIEEASKHGVGLQLSGHTHGGQIWPFGYLVRLTQPYMQGLHRHGDRTQIYVSRGTGYWGPPMRLAAPAEITHIELVSA